MPNSPRPDIGLGAAERRHERPSPVRARAHSRRCAHEFLQPVGAPCRRREVRVRRRGAARCVADAEPALRRGEHRRPARPVQGRRSACHPPLVITFPSVEETLYGSTRRARKSRATGSGWAARIRSDKYRWRRYCAHAACSASQRSTVHRVVPRPLSDPSLRSLPPPRCWFPAARPRWRRGGGSGLSRRLPRLPRGWPAVFRAWLDSLPGRGSGMKKAAPVGGADSLVTKGLRARKACLAARARGCAGIPRGDGIPCRNRGCAKLLIDTRRRRLCRRALPAAASATSRT